MLHTLIFVINLKSTLNSMPMLILNCDGLWLQYILTKYIACYGLYLIHIITCLSCKCEMEKIKYWNTSKTICNLYKESLNRQMNQFLNNS